MRGGTTSPATLRARFIRRVLRCRAGRGARQSLNLGERGDLGAAERKALPHGNAVESRNIVSGRDADAVLLRRALTR